MLNIATRESEWDDVLAAAQANADVWASVGIHPHDADQHPDVDTGKLVERAAHPRVIGIGETGLDYYYDKSDRARQQDSRSEERRVGKECVSTGRSRGSPYN